MAAKNALDISTTTTSTLASSSWARLLHHATTSSARLPCNVTMGLPLSTSPINVLERCPLRLAYASMPRALPSLRGGHHGSFQRSSETRCVRRGRNDGRVVCTGTLAGIPPAPGCSGCSPHRLWCKYLDSHELAALSSEDL